MPYKRIARELGVSINSAYRWTRDIELTSEQHTRNRCGPTGPQHPEVVAGERTPGPLGAVLRARPHQAEGRRRARVGDPLHQQGCMLYGVCSLKIHSTRVVQHVYGAIQEYGGFDEPGWLD